MLAAESINFSYSTPEDSFAKRSVIKTIEAIGGQRQLKSLYDQFIGSEHEVDFFESAVKLLELQVQFDAEPLKFVPKEGPVVFIANHPYGVLDGIVLTWLARQARPDVKVMANNVLCQAPGASNSLLPVDFGETEEARQTNVDTRRIALQTLQHDGAVGIFPAGGVAVSEKALKGPAVDTPWHPFAAKMIKMSGATVIPVYFSGQNSRMFQMASHLSYTLRLALFFFETARRIGSKLELAVGEPVTPEEIRSFGDRKEINRELRMRTFDLASQLSKPKTGYPQFDREFFFPRHMKL